MKLGVSDSFNVESSSDKVLAFIAKIFRKFLITKKENNRKKSTKMTEKSNGDSNGAYQGKKDKSKNNNSF